MLVLACGRRPNPTLPGGRDRILEYMKRHLKMYEFFMAEWVFQLLAKSDNRNLLEVEAGLSDYCDCLLIVLESESTYAELGAFAIQDKLAENMLVVNDRGFEREESFISMGPIDRVDRLSRFGPTIYVDPDCILRAAPEIVARLQSAQPKKGTGFRVSDAESFAGLEPKIRMLLLLDMIALFHPVSHKEIIHILKCVFGGGKYEVILDLHMLEALHLVRRIDDYYVRETEERKLFFRYPSLRQVRVRSDVLNHYHKYARVRTGILESKLKSES